MIYAKVSSDYLYGGHGIDKLYGNAGIDKLYGGEGNDTLWGDAGNDRLWGGHGDDKLHGGGDDDEMYGGEGDDRLWGGEGDDKLYGGEGDDELYGDDGKDTFVYRAISDGRDTIADFQIGTGANGDVIDLSVLLQNRYSQGGDLSISNFFDVIDDGINTLIEIDADGDHGRTDIVSILLLGVTGVDLSTMIGDDNLVLE